MYIIKNRNDSRCKYVCCAVLFVFTSERLLAFVRGPVFRLSVLKLNKNCDKFVHLKKNKKKKKKKRKQQRQALLLSIILLMDIL